MIGTGEKVGALVVLPVGIYLLVIFVGHLWRALASGTIQKPVHRGGDQNPFYSRASSPNGYWLAVAASTLTSGVIGFFVVLGVAILVA